MRLSFHGFLSHIARSGPTSKFLETLELPQLFFLAKYATSGDIHENITSLAITAIKRSCLLNQGVPLITSLVIKLKNNSTINKRDVHLLASYLLRTLPLSYELRKEIVAKLRVVFVKNDTVQSILCNYKKYANSFKLTPPECMQFN